MTRVEAAAKEILDDLAEHDRGSNWDASPKGDRRLARALASRILAAADAHAITELGKLVRDLRAEADTMGDSRAGLMREAADAIEAGGRRIQKLENALCRLIYRAEALIGDTGAQPIGAVLDAADECRLVVGRAALGRATGGDT